MKLFRELFGKLCQKDSDYCNIDEANYAIVSMTSPQGVERIKRHEGLRTTAYLCPAGKPTIGYGHTSTVRPSDVGIRSITPEEADMLLIYDLYPVEDTIRDRVTVPLTTNQFDALASFVFNVGTGAFQRSTLLKKLNVGDYEGAAKEFLRWNKAVVDGVLIALPGLDARRHEEMSTFMEYTP